MLVFLKSFFKHSLSYFGLFSLLVGIAGMPDDLEQWYRWIAKLMNDPAIQSLAESVVAVTQIVNAPYSRIALIMLGLVLLAWPMRWFWRLRLKISFGGKLLMTKEAWIGGEEAVELVVSSEWAKLKMPHVTEQSPNALESLARGLTSQAKTVYGASNKEKSEIKFRAYVNSVLESFSEVNSRSFRLSKEKNPEYEIHALNRFLDAALQDVIQKEFGSPPSFKV